MWERNRRKGPSEKMEAGSNNNNHNRAPSPSSPLAPGISPLPSPAAAAFAFANWAPLAPTWLCLQALLVMLRFSFPPVVGTVRV